MADIHESIAPNVGLISSADSIGRNYFDEPLEEKLRRIHMYDDPTYLNTVSMDELYETPFPSKPPVIDGLLHAGTYIFAGTPKVGKSFLMAQLAYHVSTGQPLWDYPVHKGSVLYLALEDDYCRLQKRMYRMFGAESTNNLHFAVCANHLCSGLDEQLRRFIREHEDTKLVIIDTLQKIRKTSGSDNYSYGSDYEVIAQLKRFADNNSVCLLIVHHTRKQQADDKFDMISGTNGLLGAADGAFILQKTKRTSNNAILDISGRDQQDQRIYLIRDMKRLTWEFERAETEVWNEPPDPVMDAITKFVKAERPEWSGTASELVQELNIDIKPNKLTRHLNICSGTLLEKWGIKYESIRTHESRKIRLTLLS